MTRLGTAPVAVLVAVVSGASIVPLWALASGTATAVARGMHIVALVCAIVFMLRAARSGDAAMRRPRRLLAAALAAGAAGSLLAVVYVATTGAVPVPSLVDPVTLLWVPLAAYGFWRIPQRDAVRIGMSRVVADGLVAGSALLFASWVTVMKPLVESDRWSTVGLTAQLAYPVTDVAIAAMVLSLLPRVRADLRAMLNVAAAGFLLIALSDSGGIALLARNGVIGFDWPNVTQQAGMALLAYAAWVQAAPVVGDDGRAPALDRHLPYVPVVFASLVGLVHVAQTGSLELSDALFGVLMLAAVLGRQALFARDMAAISDAHRYAAGHDGLTGLANRSLFFSHLAEHLTTPGTGPAAVVLLDLDGFKEVNDTFGHEAGDGVLQHFSATLSAAAGDALVARLGGDEFALLLTGPRAEENGRAVAEAVASAEGPAGDGIAVHVSCSAGIAAVRPDDSPADVLHRADLAMYSAKASPGCRVAAFTEGLAQQAERRHLLTSDLAGVAARQEMHLLYQPLYRLADGSLIGAEVLLRWIHPLFGIVRPDEFIPLAEDAGHIDALGGWVLEQAIGQAATWQRSGRYLPRLFVNVSAAQFTAGFARQVQVALERHGIPAERLTLEITESQVPGLAANRTMTELRASGVQIALDDFGAGYSSLAQLARLPVDVLKIDRDFVRNLGETAGRAVLDAVINLAKALGLGTVAEGIEDLAQAAEASNAGVDFGQGYLFSRPEPADEIERRLPLLGAAAPAPREPAEQPKPARHD